MSIGVGGGLFPELASFLFNAISAYWEYEMLKDTEDRLEDVITTDLQFGNELWALSKKNMARQTTHYQQVWNSESDLMYSDCPINKANRANIEHRHDMALVRDAVVMSSNMYGVGFKEHAVNRAINKDTHMHGQTYASALLHEDNQILEAKSKYYALVLSMIKRVPYGSLPTYLGNMGNAYEGLMMMHGNSMNASIASAIGSLDKLINGDGKAETSRRFVIDSTNTHETEVVNDNVETFIERENRLMRSIQQKGYKNLTSEEAVVLSGRQGERG